MSYVRLFAHGFAWNIIMSVLVGFSGFFLRILLARNFSPAEFGLFFAVLAFPTLFGSLKHLGAGAVLTREATEAFAQKHPERIHMLVRAFIYIEILCYGTVIGILFIFAKTLSIYYFQSPVAETLLKILLTASFFTIFDSAFNGVFIAHKDVRAVTVLNGLKPVLIFLFTSVSLFFDNSLLTLSFTYAVVSFFITSLYFVKYRRIMYAVPVVSEPLAPIMKKFLFGGFPVFAGVLSGSLLGNVETMVLTATRTLSEVGILNVVMPIADALQRVMNASIFLVIPISAELFLLNRSHFSLNISRIQKYATIVIIPGIVLLLTFSSWILLRFFGEKYILGSLALQLFSIGVLPSLWFVINSNILLGIGKYGMYGLINTIVAVISLSLNILLSAAMGVDGVALANLITFCIGAIVTTIFLYRIQQYVIPWIHLFKSVIAGVVAYEFMRTILPESISILSVIFVGLSGIILYGFLLFLFRVVTFGEVRRILSNIPISDKLFPEQLIKKGEL